MQTVLAVLALVAGVLGLIYSNISIVGTVPRGSGKPPQRFVRPVFVWAEALVVVGFVATLPSRHPFSPGLTLG